MTYHIPYRLVEFNIIFCLCARPEVVDRALLRPGRFGKPLYVPLPKPDERGLILKTLARSKPVDASVNLLDLGKSEICENLSGADLADLVSLCEFLCSCFLST